LSVPENFTGCGGQAGLAMAHDPIDGEPSNILAKQLILLAMSSH
jgi:hypothetical protein